MTYQNTVGAKLWLHTQRCTSFYMQNYGTNSIKIQREKKIIDMPAGIPYVS